MQVGLPRFGGEFIIRNTDPNNALPPYQRSIFFRNLPKGVEVTHPSELKNPLPRYAKEKKIPLRIGVQVTQEDPRKMKRTEKKYDTALATYLELNQIQILGYEGDNKSLKQRYNNPKNRQTLHGDRLDSASPALRHTSISYDTAPKTRPLMTGVSFREMDEDQMARPKQGSIAPVILRDPGRPYGSGIIIQFPAFQRRTPDFSQADIPVQREKKADRS